MISEESPCGAKVAPVHDAEESGDYPEFAAAGFRP